MTVAIIPAIKFKPPIIAGAAPLILAGSELCAKFAVPVTVERIITGSEKCMFCFL